MLAGNLVKKRDLTCRNLGLVLERITGATFDEVLVIWFNPSWSLRSISKRWEAPKDLKVISQ